MSFQGKSVEQIIEELTEDPPSIVEMARMIHLYEQLVCAHQVIISQLEGENQAPPERLQ